MNGSVTRRWPALLTLAALLLLAAGSFWILQTVRQSNERGQKRVAVHEPDYVMENFQYISAAKDGKIRMKIEGDTLRHFADTEESIMQQPRLTSYSPERQPLTIHSKSAHINRDHSEVRLRDNVELRRPQTRGDEELIVLSEYMVVLPEKDIAKTDQPVRARLGESTLSGIGMVVDHAQHTLTLNSRVHAIYVQPHRAKP